MGNRRKGFLDVVAAVERLPASITSQMTLLSFGFQPSKEIRARVSIPWLHVGRPQGGHEQSPIYSAMDTFVIPSLEEAFGQTALEALACETAVIGTHVGGIPEIVQDEVTGLLTPARSPQRLAECISRFYDDAELRIECGVRGRQLALQRHDSEKVSRAHEALYRKVLNSSSQPNPVPAFKVA
jgi:glycosyltransferase involved in cell wall biosynthesis